MNRSGVFLLRRRFRRGGRLEVALESAIFIRTTAGRALLGRLFQEERRATLRALFDHWLVPVNDFALGIFSAAIENFAALRTLDDDFAFAAGTRTSHPGGLAFDVLALRIIRARDEFAKASLAFHQLGIVDRAFFIQDFRRR